MKALVTGGAGFIGSWIVDDLIEQGHEVAIIDNLSSGSERNLNNRAIFYERDIRSDLSDIFEKEEPKNVFHLAAQVNLRESLKNPINDAGINILGSLNVINECINIGVNKIIFSSSGGAIYGRNGRLPLKEGEAEIPESPYGIAKLSIEHYLRVAKNVSGLDYVALRYANVYGPRQNHVGEAGVIALFLNRILNDKVCTIFGSGEQTRDYVYVKDVAKANTLALDLSGTYNVGTGIEISVNEMFDELFKRLGKGISMRVEKIPGELMRNSLDNSKLRSEGWEPEYSFEKGLDETIESFKKL
ncbi:MAG: NAD-dependent epimerase/dehydratase family protein [Nanoarchaeota archaeon]|nr:NAD-dependent epimerase/dehydratase family protein [Nanoarchaeota archaeon]